MYQHGVCSFNSSIDTDQATVSSLDSINVKVRLPISYLKINGTGYGLAVRGGKNWFVPA